MFRSPQTNLIFLFCLLLLGSFALAETFYCPSNNKLEEENCWDAPRESCDSNLAKLAAYDPVCGVTINESELIEEDTFFNDCTVCQSNLYQYQDGPCLKDRNYCESSNSETSQGSESEDAGSVCAYFKSKDFVNIYMNFSSVEEACQYETVDFWMEGPCGTLRNGRVYCLPENRPEECDQKYDPVCGFYKEEDGNFAQKVMGNECQACADDQILFHEPGPCVERCINYEKSDCGGYNIPICATYEEDGEKRNVSLLSSCIGCHYFDKEILFFVDGLCPGDKGFRCEDGVGRRVEGAVNPVCGYSTEDCTDDSCRKTYVEAPVACEDPSVIWFSLEPCPGDERILCDDSFRKSSKDPWAGQVEVCGYTSDDCTDDTCRADYENQYEACQDDSVLYFTVGSC